MVGYLKNHSVLAYPEIISYGELHMYLKLGRVKPEDIESAMSLCYTIRIVDDAIEKMIKQ